MILEVGGFDLMKGRALIPRPASIKPPVLNGTVGITL
jgi:hypothetical protein